MPPQRRYPDRPPLMVKGGLVVARTMRTKTLYNVTLNEILFRKVKSDDSDEISLREVAVNQVAVSTVLKRQVSLSIENK